ncbi:MAG: RNA methyltransferase [Candidatus Zixiibacteriota bacterium]|jgi:TrmH family RNA methyltransferase
MPITRAELKDIQSLRTKKGRKEKKRFIAEGVRVLEEALQSKLAPECIYYAPAALSERGERLASDFRSHRVKVSEVSARQLKAMSHAETTQGIAGVFPIPDCRLDKLYRSEYRRLLLCDGLADPGNLGTLIRSALAFEFDLVMVTKQTAEVYAPKVVRSSAGAVFGVPVAEVSIDELLSFAGQHDLSLIAADIHGKDDMAELERTVQANPFVLAIGSEASGVSRKLREGAGLLIRIGHSRRVESLNSGIAGSILMKQIYDMLK